MTTKEGLAALNPSALGQLSDQDLLAHLRVAAEAEREATARLIALLVELDVRRLYLGEGFSSRARPGGFPSFSTSSHKAR